MISTLLAMSLPTLALAAGPAQGDVAAAAEAFSHGQRAELGHDYARAAEFYELADDLAPRPEALRSAAKNRLSAGQAAVAATRAAELLRRYPDSQASRELAEAILQETSSSLMQLTARCDRPCVLSSDGIAVADERALSHVLYIGLGEHTVVASFEPGQEQTKVVEGIPGGEATLGFTVPASAPGPSPDPTANTSTEGGNGTTAAPKGRQRLAPAYFAVGTVVTAGLAGVTLWSGLDVLAQNRRYRDNPTQDGFDTGRRAELRTNVLIAATVVAGVATATVAVFTRWKGSGARKRASHTTPRVALDPTALTVRF